MFTLDCFDNEGQLRLSPEETHIYTLLNLFDGELERVAYAARCEIEYVVSVIVRISGKGVTCRVEDPIEKMRIFNDRIKERQKRQLERRLSPEPPKKTLKGIYRKFRKEWEFEFGDAYPANVKKDIAMLRRTVPWSGNDLDLLEEMIGTFITDWDVIKGLFKVSGSRPMLNLFCSGWFFERLRQYVTGEFRDEKNRHTEDDSPDVGW